MIQKIRCPRCRSTKLVKAGMAYDTVRGRLVQRFLCNNCKKHTIKPKK